MAELLYNMLVVHLRSEERSIIMKKDAGTMVKAIAILISLGVLTACGTANTVDYDADTAVGTEIQDLGTEEYLITAIDTAATDEEKQAKYIHYLEAVLADSIASAYSPVKDANVNVKLVRDVDATITDVGETMQVNILLDLGEELTENSIVEIAEAAATATGSETDNVTIVDTDGNVLYLKSEALPDSDV